MRGCSSVGRASDRHANDVVREYVCLRVCVRVCVRVCALPPPIFFFFSNIELVVKVLVPTGSSSRGGDVTIYVLDINQPSLPTVFVQFLCPCF